VLDLDGVDVGGTNYYRFVDVSTSSLSPSGEFAFAVIKDSILGPTQVIGISGEGDHGLSLASEDEWPEADAQTQSERGNAARTDFHPDCLDNEWRLRSCQAARALSDCGNYLCDGVALLSSADGCAGVVGDNQLAAVTAATGLACKRLSP